MTSMPATVTMSITVPLTPTPEQRKRICRHAGLSRFAWNLAIELNEAWMVQNRYPRTPDGFLYVADETDLRQMWNQWARDDLAPWVVRHSMSEDVVFCAFQAAAEHLANRSLTPKRQTFWTRPGGRFKYAHCAFPVGADRVFLQGIGDVTTGGDISLVPDPTLTGVEVTERWATKPKRGRGGGGRSKAQRTSQWDVTFRFRVV